MMAITANSNNSNRAIASKSRNDKAKSKQGTLYLACYPHCPPHASLVKSRFVKNRPKFGLQNKNHNLIFTHSHLSRYR